MDEDSRMIKVKRVEAFVMPTPPYVPVITCHLEDGRQFHLYYVPLEVVIAINKLQGEAYDVERESIFDLLPTLEKELLNVLSKRIGSVYIDEIDFDTMLYSATVEILADGVKIKRKMIPSHAVFLALMLGMNIYVKGELIKYQEYFDRTHEY